MNVQLQSSMLPPKYSKSQRINPDLHKIDSDEYPLVENLPSPPTPPNTRTNLLITPQVSIISKTPNDVNAIGTSTQEEPKYARVDIRNKRNSKQISNGDCSSNKLPDEGASYS